MANLHPASLADSLSPWSLWAIGLVALAIVIGLRTLWSTRTAPLNIRDLLVHLRPAAWLIPCLVTLVTVVIQAAPLLSPGPSSIPTVSGTSSPVLVTGEYRKDKAEAFRSALEKATGQLNRTFQKHHQHTGHWELPVELVEKHAVMASQEAGYSVEAIKTAGAMQKMYQAKIQIKPFDANYHWLRTEWKRQTQPQRWWAVASVLGLCCVVIVTGHGYMKLDIASGGIHQGKLQIAAASLVIAAGVIGIEILS